MPSDNRPITLRTYLVIRTMSATDCDWMTALEAVASTAIERPDWDLEERRTFDEWEAWATPS